MTVGIPPSPPATPRRASASHTDQPSVRGHASHLSRPHCQTARRPGLQALPRSQRTRQKVGLSRFFNLSLRTGSPSASPPTTPPRGSASDTDQPSVRGPASHLPPPPARRPLLQAQPRSQRTLQKVGLCRLSNKPLRAESPSFRYSAPYTDSSRRRGRRQPQRGELKGSSLHLASYIYRSDKHVSGKVWKFFKESAAFFPGNLVLPRVPFWAVFTGSFLSLPLHRSAPSRRQTKAPCLCFADQKSTRPEVPPGVRQRAGPGGSERHFDAL